VLAATTVEDLKEQLTQLMKGLDFCFRQVKGQLPRKKSPQARIRCPEPMRKYSQTGMGRWRRRRKRATGTWRL